jgi:ADP-ribose pyrophosphatase
VQNPNEITLIAAGKFMDFVKRGKWEFVARKNLSGIVAVVAVNARDELILVEQYRGAVDGRSIELPAGLVGDEADKRDEALADAATRELLEETGYRAQRMEYLFSGAASSGITDEIIAFFRAVNPEKVAAGGGDHAEDIIVHEVPLAEVAGWLNEQCEAGAACDIKIYAGLYFANR